MPHTSKIVALICLLAFAPGVGALYELPPEAWVTAMQGRWIGTLRYLDDSGGGNRVMLPTTLYVAASAPRAVTLHDVYHDVPGWTVDAYERWDIEVAARALRWTSGAVTPAVEACTFIGQAPAAERAMLTFECIASDAKADDRPPRYTFTLSPAAILQQKE